MRAAYEGKGGVRAVGCEGELAHDKGYYHSQYRGGGAARSGPGGRSTQSLVTWLARPPTGLAPASLGPAPAR